MQVSVESRKKYCGNIFLLLPRPATGLESVFLNDFVFKSDAKPARLHFLLIHSSIVSSHLAMLPQSVLDEFLVIPPDTTDENEWNGAWNVLLTKYFPIDDGWVVKPQVGTVVPTSSEERQTLTPTRLDHPSEPERRSILVSFSRLSVREYP